ncbi:hypothetical protein [Bdellovibrio svalbardensis]|uniref:Peptidase M48 domain-containing protein n=1 Tax=Bdellovibrio svalbardensis TaxID=2972972 RepID=A0ABT6DI02_9BACT|nr:hypothetical protein [Bdellovibrio svalbardensis]MDG0816488.1 hypothetical protein [Bdellovibrio svalbardensis]
MYQIPFYLLMLAIRFPYISLPVCGILLGASYFFKLNTIELVFVGGISLGVYVGAFVFFGSIVRYCNRRFSKISGFCVVFGAFVGSLFFSSLFIDKWRSELSPEARQTAAEDLYLQKYIPSAKIKRIVESTGMTEYSKRVFFLADPMLVKDRIQLNAFCGSDTQGQMTLGCYDKRSGRIFILDVNDERLFGLTESVAAHELLHAVYSKYKTEEILEIKHLLDQVARGGASEEVSRRISLYGDQSVRDRTSELHSIIGTEISSLPIELEEYYSKYFVMRKQIVQLSRHSEEEFEWRKKFIRSYSDKMKKVKVEIVRTQAEIENCTDTISSLNKQMLKLKANGEIEEYNRLVPTINTKIGKLAGLQKAMKKLVQKYNIFVNDSNIIVGETQEMNEAIDSGGQSASL